MPLPKPKSNESKEDFIDRCMRDSIANDEFPDNKQRLAICNSTWKEKEDKSKMNDKLERRYIDISNTDIEVRSDNDENITIQGHAAVFNSDSEYMGFTERIKPGAFRKALKSNPDVIALFNHDENSIFGRTGQNLFLKEDKDGLHMEVKQIDDDDFKRMANKVKAGLLNKQSFAFIVGKDEWKDLDTDNPKRTIIEVDELWDVSLVTTPAYQGTDASVALRSMDMAKKELKEARGQDNKESKDTESTNSGPRSVNIHLDGLTAEQFNGLQAVFNLDNNKQDNKEQEDQAEVEENKEDDSNQDESAQSEDVEEDTFSPETSNILDKFNGLKGEKDE